MKKMIVDRERLKGALWGKTPQVAEALGIHPKTLSKKMNRERGLYLEDINVIAELFSRDTMEFLREVEIDNGKESKSE